MYIIYIYIYTLHSWIDIMYIYIYNDIIWYMCNNVHMMAYEYITHQKQRLRTAPWPVERSSSSCRAHPAWGRTVIRWYPEFPQVTVVVIPVRDSTWQVTAMVIQKNWPHQPWLCITTHNGWYFTFKWLMGSFFFWMISGKIRIWDSPLPKINIRMWLW